MGCTANLSVDDRNRATEIGVAAITAFYGSRSLDLESDSEFLKGHFSRLLRRSGYSSLTVETRSKELDKAIEKIRRKCADENSQYSARILAGEPPERILTDLVGVRITCKFSDQIDEIEKLVRANCVLREAERIDYRRPKHYGNFGYAALHLVADPIEASSSVYFSGCAFELQIRSALMDIWGVVNWDIAYTDERTLPYELLRRMSTLSALFYLVDQEFIRIRDEMADRVAITLNSQETEGDNFQFSPDVAAALLKRGIAFEPLERVKLVECSKKAQTYFSRDVVLENNTTLDALALYLFDRDKFAWIVNDLSIKAVDDIDRIKVLG
jgi:ppGpp synthetase/RelA/SpoT-type nucleotidyltranferase